MKVTIHTLDDKGRNSAIVLVDDKKESFAIYNDCCGIAELMTRAFDTGKSGGTMEVVIGTKMKINGGG